MVCFDGKVCLSFSTLNYHVLILMGLMGINQNYMLVNWHFWMDAFLIVIIIEFLIVMETHSFSLTHQNVVSLPRKSEAFPTIKFIPWQYPTAGLWSVKACNTSCIFWTCVDNNNNKNSHFNNI